MDEEGAVFELSKMGVLPEAQGLKLGWKLGEKAIEKAKSVGAKKLYLESNTFSLLQSPFIEKWVL